MGPGDRVNRNLALVIAAVSLALLPSLALTMWVFPTMDDAWALLLARESGTAAIGETLRHRPLFASLLAFASESDSRFLLIGLGASAIAWAVLAWETASVWRLAFPRAPELTAVAASAAVAPIVVTTQVTTLTVVLPVLVPVLAGYAALILVWRFVQDRTALPASVVLASSGGLLVGAFLLSEYALAAAAASLIILGWLWVLGSPAARRRAIPAAIVILAASFIGFAIFQVTADFDTRPDATLSSLLSQTVGDPGQVVSDLLITLWRVSVGSYLGAAAGLRLSFHERSTVVAVVWGLLMVVALTAAYTRSIGQESEDPTDRPVSRHNVQLLLLASTAVTLIPGVIRGVLFFPLGEALSTRFFIPALPLVACFSTSLLCSLPVRSRSAAVGTIAFFLGYAAFTQPWSVYLDDRMFRTVGDALRPRVTAHSGLTIAVLSSHVARDYEVTFKATRNWPLSEARRLWAVWEGRLWTLGSPDERDLCRRFRRLDVDVYGITRRGQVHSLLLVSPENAPPLIADVCSYK